jgi:putative membrane protein
MKYARNAMSSVENFAVAFFPAGFFAAGFFFAAFFAGAAGFFSATFAAAGSATTGAGLVGSGFVTMLAGARASAFNGVDVSFFFPIITIIGPRTAHKKRSEARMIGHPSSQSMHFFPRCFALRFFSLKVMPMRAFFIRWMVTTVAVWIAASMGFLHFASDRCLLGAALVLGIVNAIVRPIVLLLSLPFIILTLGIGILIVNALLLMAVSGLLPCFHVDSFGQAFFGAIIISLVSWVLSAFIRSENGRMSVRVITREDGMKQAKGRVIE